LQRQNHALKDMQKLNPKTQNYHIKLKVVRYLVAQPEFHVFHVISHSGVGSGVGTIPCQNSQDGSFLGLS
jgi:hypothetical protein